MGPQPQPQRQSRFAEYEPTVEDVRRRQLAHELEQTAEAERRAVAARLEGEETRRIIAVRRAQIAADLCNRFEQKCNEWAGQPSETIYESELEILQDRFRKLLNHEERNIDQEIVRSGRPGGRAKKGLIDQVTAAFRPRFYVLGANRKIAAKIRVDKRPPPKLTDEDLKTCLQAHRFLKGSMKFQATPPCAILTIFEIDSGVVIYVANTDGDAVFVEVPAKLDPAEIARSILSSINPGLKAAVGNADPLTIFNGACRGVNFKELLRTQQLLRTASSQSVGVAERMFALKNMSPVAIGNVKILSGIPRDFAETESVFHSTSFATEWAREWAQIAPRWDGATSAAGLTAERASKESVLSALAHRKHVIVLIAHGNSTTLHLPEPRPDGSSVELSDLESISTAISENKPVVYMFCCESANVSGLRNWASELIRHGATAVYAPQEKIDTDRTRSLFSKFVKSATRQGNPLSAIRDAERSSRCRGMEMWIG